MDGIININKPPDKTSYSVVAKVKRLSGERRVGHAGTLDPLATGVLPVCLGQGTRIVEFLQSARKSYRAEIELGVTTDTDDASGKILRKADPSSVSREQLESALAAFRGLIRQTPPMYSAVKYQGQRLYELARAGVNVARKSRSTRIYRLEIIGWQPPVVTIEVECGKGTYIRSLAHDLGESLGCGASLKSLVRLSYGPFDIRTAVSLPRLEEAFHHGYWSQFVYPIDSVLLSCQAMVVNDATEKAIRKGIPLTLTNSAGTALIEPHEEDFSPPLCRTYTLDGRFLGVLRFDRQKGQWQPDKVFP